MRKAHFQFSNTINGVNYPMGQSNDLYVTGRNLGEIVRKASAHIQQNLRVDGQGLSFDLSLYKEDNQPANEKEKEAILQRLTMLNNSKGQLFH